MDIEALRTFRTVVRAGGVQAAAKRLYASVSSVTARIRSLEKEVGKPLFVRTGRTLALTAAGERFLEHVDRCLEILAGGEEEIRELKDAKTGELLLAATPTVATYILPPLLHAFGRAYPRLAVRLGDGSNDETLNRVKSGEAELGLLRDPGVGQSFAARNWLEDPLWLVAPAGHPVAARGRVTPRDLLGWPIIGYVRQSEEWAELRRWFQQAGLEPHLVMDLQHAETVKQLLPALQAVSLLPRAAVRDEVGRGTLQILEAAPPLALKRQVVIVHRRNLKLSHAAQLFVDFAVDWATAWNGRAQGV